MRLWRNWIIRRRWKKFSHRAKWEARLGTKRAYEQFHLLETRGVEVVRAALREQTGPYIRL